MVRTPEFHKLEQVSNSIPTPYRIADFLCVQFRASS